MAEGSPMALALAVAPPASLSGMSLPSKARNLLKIKRGVAGTAGYLRVSQDSGRRNLCHDSSQRWAPSFQLIPICPDGDLRNDAKPAKEH
jgi:hypothetical protein